MFRGRTTLRTERIAPASDAYRAAYAARRRQLRRRRELAILVALLLGVAGAGIAYAVTRTGNVRVVQVIPPSPVTVTVRATSRPHESGVAPATSSPTDTATDQGVPRPAIVWKPIPFSARRRAEGLE
jgi:hypothetical protein